MSDSDVVLVNSIDLRFRHKVMSDFCIEPDNVILEINHDKTHCYTTYQPDSNESVINKTKVQEYIAHCVACSKKNGFIVNANDEPMFSRIKNNVNVCLQEFRTNQNQDVFASAVCVNYIGDRQKPDGAPFYFKMKVVERVIDDKKQWKLLLTSIDALAWCFLTKVDPPTPEMRLNASLRLKSIDNLQKRLGEMINDS